MATAAPARPPCADAGADPERHLRADRRAAGAGPRPPARATPSTSSPNTGCWSAAPCWSSTRDRRPAAGAEPGAGWVHGDFHPLNVLYRGRGTGRDRRLGPAGRPAARRGGGTGRRDLLRTPRRHAGPGEGAGVRARLPAGRGRGRRRARGRRAPGVVGAAQRLLDAALALPAAATAAPIRSSRRRRRWRCGGRGSTRRCGTRSRAEPARAPVSGWRRVRSAGRAVARCRVAPLPAVARRPGRWSSAVGVAAVRGVRRRRCRRPSAAVGRRAVGLGRLGRRRLRRRRSPSWATARSPACWACSDGGWSDVLSSLAAVSPVSVSGIRSGSSSAARSVLSSFVGVGDCDGRGLVLRVPSPPVSPSLQREGDTRRDGDHREHREQPHLAAAAARPAGGRRRSRRRRRRVPGGRIGCGCVVPAVRRGAAARWCAAMPMAGCGRPRARRPGRCSRCRCGRPARAASAARTGPGRASPRRSGTGRPGPWPATRMTRPSSSGGTASATSDGGTGMSWTCW